MADITVQLEESPIEVVVENDKPGDGEGKKTEPLAQPSDGGKTQPTVEESIEDLRAQVEQSKQEAARRRAEGERQIQAAFAARERAEKELVTTQKGAVETTIDRLKADKETAKRDYKAAMEKGDYDAASDAHDRIATVAARLVEAEKAQISLAEAEKAPPVRTPQRAPQAERSTQIEQMAQSAEEAGDHRSAAWLRAHPEFEGKAHLLSRAHNFAMGHDGIQAGTEEYIQLVEQKLGIDSNNGGRPHDDPSARTPTRQQQQHRGPAAAPVRRDAVTTTTGRKAPTTIRLSESEQKAAIEVMAPLYPNASNNELLKLYAQQKAALIEDGNPNYDGQ